MQMISNPAFAASRRTTFAVAAYICALLALAGCGDDETTTPIPILSFTECEGPPGSCGTDSCCASESDVHIFGDFFECTVSDSVPSTRYINFDVWDRDPFRQIEAEVVVYEFGDVTASAARDCQLFRYTAERDHGTDIYEADGCTTATAGGCEVRILDLDDGSITGEFTCIELLHTTSPGSTMSTTRSGAVGAGTFTFDNCNFF